MSNFDSTVTTASLAIVVSSLTAAIALFSRMTERKSRLLQLAVAHKALESHINALNALDNERTPPLLLAFALVSSEILTDEENIRKISEKYDEKVMRQKEKVPDQIKNIADQLVRNDFDSVSAFMEAFSFAVVYAENRWPECAGRLGHPFKFIMAEASERHDGLAELFGKMRHDGGFNFDKARPQPI